MCPCVCGSVFLVVSAVGICLQNVAGLVLALAGMIWYSYLKMPPAAPKAKDAPPTPADADHTNNVEPGGFLEAEGTPPPPTLWGGVEMDGGGDSMAGSHHGSEKSHSRSIFVFRARNHSPRSPPRQAPGAIVVLNRDK